MIFMKVIALCQYLNIELFPIDLSDLKDSPLLEEIKQLEKVMQNEKYLSELLSVRSVLDNFQQLPHSDDIQNRKFE